MTPKSIQTRSTLGILCDRLKNIPWIALDTEFISENIYQSQLCLIQIATAYGCAYVDPLALGDISELWDVLVTGDHETLVFGGRSELEFFFRETGRFPRHLYDVQIAAGLVGYDYPVGYANLLSRLLDVHIENTETRTDWRARPLSARQLAYAMDDVIYLNPMRERIDAQLSQLNRTDWLAQEIHRFEHGVLNQLSPERWRRVLRSVTLDRRGLSVVKRLWQWRDEEARRRNCIARNVLRDDLLVELGRRKPVSLEDMRALRGMERGDLKKHLPALVACVQNALRDSLELCPALDTHPSTSRLTVIGQFLYAALGCMCRNKHLSVSMVGSPTDVREWLLWYLKLGTFSTPPTLAVGWRAELVEPFFKDLLSGTAVIRITDPLSETPLEFVRY